MAGKEIRSTNQIAKIMTAKKCISLMDKLKEADPRHYAQIHAKGETSENGFKVNSLIQIILQDYSNGTGANNVKVTFNLLPEQIQFFLTRIEAGFLEFEYQSDKIFGNPDAGGYCTAQQFRLKRSVRNDSGQENRSPWNLYISNGRGIKVQNRNGGSYMKGGSYVKEAAAFIQLTDMDFYMLLKRADSYIREWERLAAAKVIPQGIELYEKTQRENRQYGQARYGGAQYGGTQYGQAQYGQAQEAPQYGQAQEVPQYGQSQYGQVQAGFAPQDQGGVAGFGQAYQPPVYGQAYGSAGV